MPSLSSDQICEYEALYFDKHKSLAKQGHITPHPQNKNPIAQHTLFLSTNCAGIELPS